MRTYLKPNVLLALIPRSFRRPIRWFFAITILSTAPMFASGQPSNMNAQRHAPFDPEKCTSGDKRYVYWAARDKVFRFLYRADIPLYPRTGRNGENGIPIPGYMNVPPAPMPQEPEGCFGNPLRGGSVPYMRAFTEESFRRLVGRPLNISSDAAWVHGHFAMSDHHLRDSRERSYRLRFEKQTQCRTLDADITECLLQRGSFDNYRLSRALKIPGSLLYPAKTSVTDLHLLLRSDIASQVDPSINGQVVQSEVDLLGAVRLLNSFRIFPNEIKHIAPFLKGQIDRIHAAYVPSYLWTRK
ncbi:hypothetical protein FN976_25690 [Caenimonas sedimenti]|uniref:Uncharacterized protein n=1 Tax=Caenimonas sedimenti TaxID=2596921 RepID=A0A562ZGS9_9BURK|nr:hypothetical protein [Caenimonas sedimenti]TWO67780.1 hypothetical protein FN976_25690 [Caenimonas sedimenti]